VAEKRQHYRQQNGLDVIFFSAAQIQITHFSIIYCQTFI